MRDRHVALAGLLADGCYWKGRMRRRARPAGDGTVPRGWRSAGRSSTHHHGASTQRTRTATVHGRHAQARREPLMADESMQARSKENGAPRQHEIEKQNIDKISRTHAQILCWKFGYCIAIFGNTCVIATWRSLACCWTVAAREGGCGVGRGRLVTGRRRATGVRRGAAAHIITSRRRGARGPPRCSAVMHRRAASADG